MGLSRSPAVLANKALTWALLILVSLPVGPSDWLQGQKG